MIAIVPSSVALGVDEFDLLWRRLQPGDKPVLLRDAQAFAPTLDELSRIDNQAWDRLHERGLVEGENVDQDLEDSLRVLAAPEVQADIRIQTPDAPRRSALGCMAGQVALVATIDQHTVHLVPVEPQRLAEKLLSHLSEYPPAPGRPVSIPARLVDGERLTAANSREILERAGLPMSTIQQVQRVLSGQTRLQASIGVAARDGFGVLQRADQAIAVMDTDGGRVMIERDASLMTITPATREQVATATARFIDVHRRSLSTVH